MSTLVIIFQLVKSLQTLQIWVLYKSGQHSLALNIFNLSWVSWITIINLSNNSCILLYHWKHWSIKMWLGLGEKYNRMHLINWSMRWWLHQSFICPTWIKNIFWKWTWVLLELVERLCRTIVRAFNLSYIFLRKFWILRPDMLSVRFNFSRLFYALKNLAHTWKITIY